MDKILNGECRNTKNLMNKYLEKQIEYFKVEQHIETCRDCQDTSGESEKLKNFLKQAVEKEFAPQSLIDSIRQGIRSQI